MLRSFFTLVFLGSATPAFAVNFSAKLTGTTAEGVGRRWELSRSGRQLVLNGLNLPPENVYRRPASMRTLLAPPTSPIEGARCHGGYYEHAVRMAGKPDHMERGCMGDPRFLELKAAFEVLEEGY